MTLGVDADLGRILALLEEPGLQDAVVCTHGEVIGQVLTPAGRRRVGGRPTMLWPKGSTWLLDGANGRRTHAGYLPPLAPAHARSVASATGGR
jgi:hypothetical protein